MQRIFHPDLKNWVHNRNFLVNNCFLSSQTFLQLPLENVCSLLIVLSSHKINYLSLPREISIHWIFHELWQKFKFSASCLKFVLNFVFHFIVRKIDHFILSYKIKISMENFHHFSFKHWQSQISMKMLRFLWLCFLTWKFLSQKTSKKFFWERIFKWNIKCYGKNLGTCAI